MHLPSRRARVVLLAGCATFAVAAPASAAPSASIDGAGKLTVSFSGTDAVTLAAQNGNVKLGATELSIPLADVKAIEVLEDATGTGANTVDLSAVTAADYPQLASVLVKATGGIDTLTGSQLADRIEGGRQNDTMNGRDGNDTLVWNPGEDSDVMNGGDGIDTVIDIGGGGDEQFVVKPKAGDPSRVDASRINNPFTLDIGGTEKLIVNGNGGNDTITGSVGLAGVIRAELNGGDGNDGVTGTDGEDLVTGGAGNDTLLGARGDDDVRGDDGDDLMVWNPGEGTDKMEGGAGTDVAQDNGGGGPEHFIVSANGTRVTATRDNVGAPFFLDIGTAETLDLNTNGGDDSVDVNGGLAPLIRVDADLGDGNDAITARNDSAQTINGGAGADSAQVDATDVTTAVEAIDAPDVTAPKVAVASKQLKLRRGLVRLAVSCPAGESACTGTATILYKGAKVGSVAIKLDGGQTKTYKIALKRKARRANAVKVRIRVSDDAGNTAKVVKRLKVTR